jgi:hypothetical protein
VSEPAPRTVGIVLGGSGNAGLSELHAVLGRARAAKVAIEGYTLHEASLDDVFLRLTGRPKMSTDAEGAG